MISCDLCLAVTDAARGASLARRYVQGSLSCFLLVSKCLICMHCDVIVISIQGDRKESRKQSGLRCVFARQKDKSIVLQYQGLIGQYLLIFNIDFVFIEFSKMTNIVYFT